MKDEFFIFRDQKIVYVPAKPEKGFNTGYCLKYQVMDKKPSIPFLIECNNFEPNDSYDETKMITLNNLTFDGYHDQCIRGLSNYVVLMPVFMRTPKILPNGDRTNIDYRALTSEAIWSKDKISKRVDNQLVAMMDDAREFFKTQNLTLEEKVICVGFSDSAKFAQRFAFLHPELVKGVFVGAQGALMNLPVDSYKGKTLNYPLGTHDYERLTGHKFDFDTYNKIIQYWTIGDLDDNDIVPYIDCITPEERKIIEDIYCKDMIKERWNAMLTMIKDCGLTNITCVRLPNEKHEIRYKSMRPFLAEFYKKLIKQN